MEKDEKYPGDISIFVDRHQMIKIVNKSIFNLIKYAENDLVGEPIQKFLENRYKAMTDYSWMPSLSLMPLIS